MINLELNNIIIYTGKFEHDWGGGSSSSFIRKERRREEAESIISSFWRRHPLKELLKAARYRIPFEPVRTQKFKMVPFVVQFPRSFAKKTIRPKISLSLFSSREIVSRGKKGGEGNLLNFSYLRFNSFKLKKNKFNYKFDFISRESLREPNSPYS